MAYSEIIPKQRSSQKDSGEELENNSNKCQFYRLAQKYGAQLFHWRDFVNYLKSDTSLRSWPAGRNIQATFFKLFKSVSRKLL